MNKSRSGEMNEHDWRKVLRDMSLAMVAAFASSLLLNLDIIQGVLVSSVEDYANSSNIAVFVPFFTALIASLFGGIRRFLKDNSK